MRRICLTVILSICVNSCFATTFAERVVLAKKIESQKVAHDYLYGRFFTSLGQKLGEIMAACLAQKDANQGKFTVVADISGSGEFRDADFEPKLHNTAGCFVKEVSTLRAPPAPVGNGETLPIVIEMAVKP